MRESIYKEVLRLKILARLNRECADRAKIGSFETIPLRIERIEPEDGGPNRQVCIHEDALRYQMAWAKLREEFENEFNISDS